eukprot:scaffold759_cov122-Skeletonema_marinoi.AAC.1
MKIFCPRRALTGIAPGVWHSLWETKIWIGRGCMVIRSSHSTIDKSQAIRVVWQGGIVYILSLLQIRRYLDAQEQGFLFIKHQAVREYLVVDVCIQSRFLFWLTAFVNYQPHGYSQASRLLL